MNKNLLLANFIILFYIIQRVTEMLISKDNEKWLKENCHGVEVDESESKKMKIFHTCWFVALITETNISQSMQNGMAAIIIYVLLAAGMLVRFYSVEKLKQFWTIKIFSVDHQSLVTEGIYRFIRHPNYLVVISEFILLPLLLNAYFTLIIFTVLNLFVITKRIKLEERTLMEQSDYSEKFKGVKRLIPFIIMLTITIFNPLSAKEQVYKFKNYEEAKKAEDFIRFAGSSTKFGLITTGFDGYAKDFKVNYDLTGNQLSGLDVIVVASELDTDVNSRNEKMVKDILNKEKFPAINVKIPEKVLLTEGEQTISMQFTVKDKQVTKPVKVKVENVAGRFHITGSADLGIKELSLPDPSIAIAKVRDEIELNFSIHI